MAVEITDCLHMSWFIFLLVPYYKLFILASFSEHFSSDFYDCQMVVEMTKCNHNSLSCHQNVIKKSKIPSRCLDSRSLTVVNCHLFCSPAFLVVDSRGKGLILFYYNPGGKLGNSGFFGVLFPIIILISFKNATELLE